MAGVIATSGVVIFEAYWRRLLYPVTALTAPQAANKAAALLWLLTILAVMFRMVYRRMESIERRQYWLIDAVNAKLKHLSAGFKYTEDGFKAADARFKNLFQHIHDLRNGSPEPGKNTEPSQALPRWPWGEHHTEYLGHLEAAARKWWNLYDPTDPTTAPTNEMVSEWLHSERKISKEKAKAIASMLRPDGLPTGPRK